MNVGSEMEDRLIRLEERQKFHDKEIAELKESTKMLSDKLDGMLRTLSMIRNILVGAIAFAVAEQMGVLKAIMAIF